MWAQRVAKVALAERLSGSETAIRKLTKHGAAPIGGGLEWRCEHQLARTA